MGPKEKKKKIERKTRGQASSDEWSNPDNKEIRIFLLFEMRFTFDTVLEEGN